MCITVKNKLQGIQSNPKNSHLVVRFWVKNDLKVPSPWSDNSVALESRAVEGGALCIPRPASRLATVHWSRQTAAASGSPGRGLPRPSYWLESLSNELGEAM